MSLSTSSTQTAEDGLGDTVKPRLMEAEADLERVLVIDDRDTPLTLADERMHQKITACFNPSGEDTCNRKS